MNAPTTFHPTPALAPHVERVTAWRATCTGADLETRARLLLAADTASAALWHCTETETVIMGEIMRLGQFYAYSDYPAETLRALLMALRKMSQAAAFLAEFAGGETDARG